MIGTLRDAIDHILNSARKTLSLFRRQIGRHQWFSRSNGAAAASVRSTPGLRYACVYADSRLKVFMPLFGLRRKG